MIRWEYRVIAVDRSQGPGSPDDVSNLDVKLNELGADGWELCGMSEYGSVFIFTRQVTERAEYCHRCNTDTHVCPGCGASLRHGEEACAQCR